MSEDEKIVQPDAASQGAESKQGETSVEGVTSEKSEVSQGTEHKEGVSPQLLTPEQVKEMIKTSLAEDRERIRQSVTDKARYEVEQALRGRQIAEGTLTGFKGRLGEIDSEMAKDLELAEYKAREKALQDAAQEATKMQEYNAFTEAFNSQTKKHLAELGIDLDDKGLDLAEDELIPLARRDRIDTSIRKILKAKEKAAEEKESQKMKDIEAKIRKDLGLDSVDTSNPVGVKSNASSKAELNRKYAQGEISYKEYEEGSKKYR